MIREAVCHYVNPFDQTIVFSGNEKNQIQVLVRLKPLPMTMGHREICIHDHMRNGTT